MDVLRFTLIADGSSDKTLLNIIKWSLDDIFPTLPNEGKFADFRGLKNPPKISDINDRIKQADYYYPFDILFYHRDAEKINTTIVSDRKVEILSKTDEKFLDKIIVVVPVKMMETWLLINEEAIKKASGNRNYNGQLNLLASNRLETLNSPKDYLHDKLRLASGLSGRKLANFNVHQSVHLVSENIDDFSPLRQLSSFLEFENDLKNTVVSLIQ